MYMWNMMVGGMDDDFATIHRKTKAVQCALLEQAWQCLNHQMVANEWQYFTSAQQNIAMDTLDVMYGVAAEICPLETTCHFKKGMYILVCISVCIQWTLTYLDTSVPS